MLMIANPLAEKIEQELKDKVEFYKSNNRVVPALATVRLGEKPDDVSYENQLSSLCEKLNVPCRNLIFDEKMDSDALVSEIEKLNKDDSVGGILVFRPLPKHIDNDKVCNSVSIEKDVDCMNPDSLTHLIMGKNDSFAPCTPEAVVTLLKYYDVDFTGKNVVIVNRSLVLGKPLIFLLLNENATVTVCHSKTVNLPEITKNADIVVCGTGSPEFFTEKYFGTHSIIADAGISMLNGKLTGDVNRESVENFVKAISPVPGGIGTITSLILLKHTLKTDR